MNFMKTTNCGAFNLMFSNFKYLQNSLLVIQAMQECNTALTLALKSNDLNKINTITMTV